MLLFYPHLTFRCLSQEEVRKAKTTSARIRATLSAHWADIRYEWNLEIYRLGRYNKSKKLILIYKAINCSEIHSFLPSQDLGIRAVSVVPKHDRWQSPQDRIVIAIHLQSRCRVLFSLLKIYISIFPVRNGLSMARSLEVYMSLLPITSSVILSVQRRCCEHRANIAPII